MLSAPLEAASTMVTLRVSLWEKVMPFQTRGSWFWQTELSTVVWLLGSRLRVKWMVLSQLWLLASMMAVSATAALKLMPAKE